MPEPRLPEEVELRSDWAEAKKKLQAELAREAQKGPLPLAGAAAEKATIRTPPNQRITPARHVQALADALQAATGITNFGTYYGHSPTPERAVDIFVPISPTTLGDKAAAWILANWDRFGSRYLIWRQRITWNDGWQWMEDRGDPTQNHYDHLHWAAEETAPPLPDPPPPKKEKFVPGTSFLTNPASRGVLDCFGESKDDTAPVGVWTINGEKNQSLRLHGDGRLAFEHSGKLLDGDGSSNIVHQYADHGLSNQRWDVEDVKWGLVAIRNRATGRYLTAHGRGERVTQEERREGSPDQVWTRTDT